MACFFADYNLKQAYVEEGIIPLSLHLIPLSWDAAPRTPGRAGVEPAH